ncbi:MAG: bifunctional metallophosphatase/5'-nucleotidase [Alistipes sp.]|nr:bifunctional metallophosphatase/5'-nucleotidase [Alistipes sp.]
MRKSLFFLISFLLIGVIGWQLWNSKERHIYIIATNDIHASIEAMPKLATIVNELEQEGEVIIVDSGDRVSGNAYVDDSQYPGVPIIELMNNIGYSVATLGNHEFDKGSKALDMMLSSATFPIVCANMEAKNGALEPLPYTTIKCHGVEFGFAGIVDTDGGGRPLGGNSAYTNYTFSHDIETAYEICEEVATKCDMVILLSHMGLDRDRELTKLSPKCAWIAGGHSHDIVNEEFNGVHISQNNKNLRYVTIADICVKGGEILDIVYELVNTADITPDEAMLRRVDEIKSLDPTLNEVVAVATESATKEGVSNFTIAALANYPYPDGFTPEITLYHYGGIRLDSFDKGDIKRVEILNNDPFMSYIYTGEMTPKQLRDFIIRKYNNGTAEKPDKESHYPYFRSDTPYTIILDEDGNATDVVFKFEERKYRVAMCNYIAENYIDSEIVSKQLHPTNISVREAMLHHIASFKESGFTPDNRCYQKEQKAK